jgi:hypothetical protein
MRFTVERCLLEIYSLDRRVGVPLGAAELLATGGMGASALIIIIPVNKIRMIRPGRIFPEKIAHVAEDFKK